MASCDACEDGSRLYAVSWTAGERALREEYQGAEVISLLEIRERGARNAWQRQARSNSALQRLSPRDLLLFNDKRCFGLLLDVELRASRMVEMLTVDVQRHRHLLGFISDAMDFMRQKR